MLRKQGNTDSRADSHFSAIYCVGAGQGGEDLLCGDRHQLRHSNVRQNDDQFIGANSGHSGRVFHTGAGALQHQSDKGFAVVEAVLETENVKLAYLHDNQREGFMVVPGTDNTASQLGDERLPFD